MFEEVSKAQAARIMNYGADLGALYLEAPALAVKFVSHFSKKSSTTPSEHRHETAQGLFAKAGLTLDAKQVAQLLHSLDSSLS